MDELQLFTTIRCDPELLKVPGQGLTNAGWNENPSPFYMLDFHRDRVLKAAIHWGWDAVVKALEGEEGLRTLEAFLRTSVPELANSPYRAKVLFDRTGSWEIVKAPTGSVHLSNLFPPYLPAPQRYTVVDSSGGGRLPERNFEFEVLVDKQATTKSEFTHFKTTHRPMYEEARHRAGILNLTDKKEVLLVNADDRSIMEASIMTPYFWRRGSWVTPLIPREFDVTRGSGGNDGTTRRWALENDLVVERIIYADSLVDGEECWLSNALKGFVHGKVKLL